MCRDLSDSQKAALKRAVELTQRYSANASTSAIWDHLISLVEQRGSLAAMLRVVAGPLLHQYGTPAFQPGPDLQWFRMRPAEATAYSNGLLAKISAANTTLFGPSPQPPSRPFLLQNTVDWLCCDVDAMKLALAAPEARVQSSMGAAAHAVMSALQSAAVVAAASARGDGAAASRAAQAAAAAAQSAVQHAQQLQALGVSAAPTATSSSIPSLQLQQQAVPTPMAIEEPAAALSEEEPSTEPAAVAVAGDTGSLDGSAGVGAEPCTHTMAASLQQAAADADMAAELAEGLQPDVLPRGAGMLVLFSRQLGRQSFAAASRQGFGWGAAVHALQHRAAHVRSRSAAAAKGCTDRAGPCGSRLSRLSSTTAAAPTTHWPLVSEGLQAEGDTWCEPAAALPTHSHMGQEVHGQLHCCLQQL